MTELIAYRYKQRAADGGATPWTPWRSGRFRAEMMTELREINATNELIIVQCAVPRPEPDEINGRENDLWVWTRNGGWQKTNARNWFVDTCDPTHRYDDDDDDDPFGGATVKHGVEHITVAIETAEQAEETNTTPNVLTGEPAEEYPSIHGGDIPNEGYVKNKFVDSVPFTIEGKIG